MRAELEKWWVQLPQAWQFQRDFNVETRADHDGPAVPEMEDCISMLRADYIGHQLAIDYPVIDFIRKGVHVAQMEEIVTRFIDNNLRFIALLSPMVRYHHPNLLMAANGYILFPLCLIY